MTSRVADLNGWYEVAANPLSKVGVFPYSARSIKAPGWQADPNKIYMVYRPAEELGDPETVQSFRLVPWVNDHAMLGDPDVDASLQPAEKKGIHGVVGEKTFFDPTRRTLYGNVKLFSKQLADAIDVGKKELSLGFRCVYEFVSGVFEGQPFDAIQRCIRGNHMASVAHGRMGPDVAVLDHFVFALDTRELAAMTIAIAKTTRRAAIMKQLGVTDEKGFLAALDAEVPAEGDGTGGGADMTIAELSTMVKAIAPQLKSITDTLASLAPAATSVTPVEEPTDEMEPVIDATGAPVMGADGKPTMKKKDKPVATAPAVGVDAMEATVTALRASSNILRKKLGATAGPAIAAMDEQIFNAETELARIRLRTFSPAMAAMDARLKAAEKVIAAAPKVPDVATLLAEVGQRDALAKRISDFVGTFDHAELSLAKVAEYGVSKLGLKNVAKGQEVTALNAYFHNRTPPSADNVFALDAAHVPAAGKSKVSAYLAGRTKAA